MSDTICVTLIAVQPNELGLVICKSCNEVIATLPTDGYKKFYVLCSSCQETANAASKAASKEAVKEACRETNKEAS